jgi:hypothetical protein
MMLAVEIATALKADVSASGMAFSGAVFYHSPRANCASPVAARVLSQHAHRKFIWLKAEGE